MDLSLNKPPKGTINWHELLNENFQKIMDFFAGLAKVATSGSYKDLKDKPEIPEEYVHPETHQAAMITGLENALNKLDNIEAGANKTILNDTVASASIKEAATANAVKKAYDLAASKESSIEESVTTDFFSGTKTWRDLATDVRAVVLTGLTTVSSVAITAADTILDAFGKLQAQILKKAPLSQPDFIEENETFAATDGKVENSITLSINGVPIIIKSTNIFMGGGGKKATGSGNTALGLSALNDITSAGFNTGLGGDALKKFSAGWYNTALGDSSLINMLTGEENTAIGHAAGAFLSDGATQQKIAFKSVFIGDDSQGGALDARTNQIVMGYKAKGQGSNTAHIGNENLETISFGPGTSTAFTNRSDPRIKEDIKPADTEICYNDIKDLPLCRFKYKDFVGNTRDKHLTGFLSSDFGKLLPKAVHKSTQSFDARDSDGNIIYETKIVEEIDDITGEMHEVEKEIPKQVLIEDCESIDTSQIVPTLLGAVQFLMQKVESLEKQIAKMNN